MKMLDVLNGAMVNEINPSDVAVWLTTQSAVVGASYLERYATAIRTAPQKLNLSWPKKEHPPAKDSITKILTEQFSNGFRLDSQIELTRFRRSMDNNFVGKTSISDEKLTTLIIDCGTQFGGKVYAVSEQTKKRIKELAENYFSEGARVIFYEEFYAKNENWLFEKSVVSKEMLIEILRPLFSTMSFTQTYFGYSNESAYHALEKEMLRVWGDDVLLNYRQIAERLTYVPVHRIKYALGQNHDFIWNSTETFSHISKVDITDEERIAIRETAMHECANHHYISVVKLPLDEIIERNYDLSISAIHNAIYRICLNDEYDKRGKVITRKGDNIDAISIMKKHCLTLDRCALDDLLDFEKNLTGESHRWMPMGIGYDTMVRINKDTYVADKYVHFDVDMIDKAIGLFVKGKYLPLKSFTTFGVFPDCGQVWNLFLLESYCRRFSRQFRFDAPSVNSRNAGAVICKSCGMSYMEIMADAVVNADIPLKDSAINRFLFDNGYIGKSTTAKVGDVINIARRYARRDGTEPFRQKQCFGGHGDLTKEKYDEPDWTPEEYNAFMDAAKAEAIAAGTW